MTNVCQDCQHFDPDGTGLPVCLLHRRFMNGEWSCGDHTNFSKQDDDGSDEGSSHAAA